MFKSIPKSDITVRPFKVFKNWSFNEDTINLHAIERREGAFEDYEAFKLYGSGSNYDFSYSYNEYAIDRSIRAMFYNNAPKLVAVVTNWNLAKHKDKKQRYYLVQNINDITNNTITNTSGTAAELISTGSGYFKIAGSNGVVIPTGFSSDRPGYAVIGMIRYNIDLGLTEIWDGLQWSSVAGSSGAINVLQAEEIAIQSALIIG